MGKGRASDVDINVDYHSDILARSHQKLQCSPLHKCILCVPLSFNTGNYENELNEVGPMMAGLVVRRCGRVISKKRIRGKAEVS